MKQIELELKKRLLIVEAEEANEFIMSTEMKAGAYRVICKGSELSEEIAKELVNSLWDHYKNYLENDNGDVGNYKRLIKNTALESFISAIEAKQIELGIKIDLSKSLIFEIL